jgi:hypothetical protein
LGAGERLTDYVSEDQEYDPKYALEELLKENEQYVREVAAEALYKIKKHRGPTGLRDQSNEPPTPRERIGVGSLM